MQSQFLGWQGCRCFINAIFILFSHRKYLFKPSETVGTGRQAIRYYWKAGYPTLSEGLKRPLTGGGSFNYIVVKCQVPSLKYYKNIFNAIKSSNIQRCDHQFS